MKTSVVPEISEYMTASELASKLGWERTKIYRLMNRGAFPRPIKTGGVSLGWLPEQITRWQQKQLEEAGHMLGRK